MIFAVPAVDRVVAIRDGRTSSEFIRRKSYAQQINEVGELEQMNQEPEEMEAQEELAVVDNAGRLQIPRSIWAQSVYRVNQRCA